MRKQITFDAKKTPFDATCDAGSGVQIRAVEDGYVAEGPGFYVWDEDRNEVIRAARQFSRGGSEISRTRRMLRILPESDIPATS